MHRNWDVWRISRHWKQLLPACSRRLYIGCVKRGYRLAGRLCYLLVGRDYCCKIITEAHKSRKLWFLSNAMNAKMPCFCRVFFCQIAVIFWRNMWPWHPRFHRNILFLINIIWSVLCEFNAKIFTFPLPLLQNLCAFVTYWHNMWPWRHRSMYFT